MTTDARAIVNKYLQYLEDESSIRDEKAIAAAEARVDDAPTAADKLIALSELERLRDGDPSELIAEFVSVARQWGRENNVTLGAWKALNVPDDVLAQARITGYGQAAPSTTRRTRVSAETVKAAIPDGEFTVSELADASGATAATARNVVGELLSSKELVEVGERPSERGRAAKLYAKA